MYKLKCSECEEQKQASNKQNDKWIFFNRELAEKLGGMDGIPGAILCYGVHSWLKAGHNRLMKNQYVYFPTTNGQKLAYRSLRQLESDYQGLWDHSGLQRIINRTEAKDVGLTVVRDKGQLHFALSDALKKLHGNRHRDFTTDGLLGFKLSEAVEVGIIPACFLASLRFQAETFPNPVTDDAGNIFGELSAKTLTARNEKGKRIYPISEDAANDALKTLRTKGKIIQHPNRKSFYRLPANGENVPVLSIEQPKSQPAKVDRQPAIVDASFAETDCNPMENDELCNFPETLYSNLCSKLDRKCLTQEAIGINPSAPCHSFNLSTGGQFLMDVCKESALRHEDKTPVAFFDNAIYSVQDADTVAFAGIELPYEYIPVDRDTGKLYSRKVHLDRLIEDAKKTFDSYRMVYTNTDLHGLREVFINHPLLTGEHISELLDYGFNFLSGELFKKPAKGHDCERFRRIVKTVKQFLRYLPQLARELYQHDSPKLELITDRSTGKTSVDYSGMAEPYLSIAFADGKTPIFHDVVTTVEQMPVPAHYLEGGKWVEVETGKTTDVEHERYRPVYYSDWMKTRLNEYNAIYGPCHPDYEKMKALPLASEPTAVEPIELSIHPKARQRQLASLEGS